MLITRLVQITQAIKKRITLPGCCCGYTLDQALGLLVDGQVSMAKGMVEHFIFEIKALWKDPQRKSQLLPLPLTATFPH